MLTAENERIACIQINRLHPLFTLEIYITKGSLQIATLAINGIWKSLALDCHVRVPSSWFSGEPTCNFKMDHLFKCKNRSFGDWHKQVSILTQFFFPVQIAFESYTITAEWLEADSRGILCASFCNSKSFRIYCADISHHSIIRPSRCIARIEWTPLTLIRHNNAINSNKKHISTRTIDNKINNHKMNCACGRTYRTLAINDLETTTFLKELSQFYYFILNTICLMQIWKSFDNAFNFTVDKATHSTIPNWIGERHWKKAIFLE